MMPTDRLPKMSFFLYSAIAAFIVASVGCAQEPARSNVPSGASFMADVLDDGTKLFTLRMRLPKPEFDVARSRAYRDDPEMQAEARRRARADHSEPSKRALQAMLQENGYCREGYVIHELYEDRTDYVIRGECRDAANDADRARYPRRRS
jgi:hypothetical protein